MSINPTPYKTLAHAISQAQEYFRLPESRQLPIYIEQSRTNFGFDLVTEYNTMDCLAIVDMDGVKVNDYHRNGYLHRRQYLQELASQYSVDYALLVEIANLCGQANDFTTLITTLETARKQRKDIY